jgi:hypothetical protein
MSTPIAITRFWSDWRQVASGTGGSVTIDSDGLRATCAGTTSGGRGYMQKYLPARPGERITFSFLARRISGQPQASIDYPAAGTSKAVVDIDSDQLQEYTIEYIVPFTTDETADYIQCTVGVFTTPIGECEVISPSICVSGSSQGFLRVWCAGLIALEKTAGVTTATINSNFINAGIKSVAWNSATKKLTVETLKSVNSSFSIRPILSAEFTTDRLPNVIAKAGRYSPVTGEFEVQFNQGGTVFIDINAAMADGDISFLSVWAMGL